MSKTVDRYAQKDQQLFAEVQKLKDGNYDSYQNIYELSKNYIYKVIYDIVQDHHTTEDMMQETYLQVYNKIDSLREAQAFYVWAGRIASNLTLRYLQKYRHEVLVEVTDDDGEEFFFDKMVNDNEAFIPESVLENEEQQCIIAGILEGLSPEQKLTVQYFYYEEMSVNDIAALMECSAGTVKSRLNYARKSLKTAVSQFETDNNVKLYSLSSLPIFFLVFKDLSEVLALAAGATSAAAVAGGAVAGGAVVAGGSAGSAGAAVSGGAVAAAETAGSAGAAVGGGSVAAGTTGGAGAAVGGGTVAAGTAGTAGGTGATTGFLGTMAGKVAVAAAVVVVGGAATVAVTQSLGDKTPVVEQEFVRPWTIKNGMEVQCITEDLEGGELGSDYRKTKDSYYDTDGNLIYYEIREIAKIEECGHRHAISYQYYYPDGTPWNIQEDSNFTYGASPQYGTEVETYTSNVVQYYPDGMIYASYTTEEILLHGDTHTSGLTLSHTEYKSDGSVDTHKVYELIELPNDRWRYFTGTTYDADGTIKSNETYEYDENGENTRINYYNADGELRYYRAYDETNEKWVSYNPDGTLRN